MSDTPRTDSLLTAILDSDGFVHNGNCPQRWVNHARELERELNAANQIAKKYEDRYFAALERIKRLEDAGDALKASGYFGGWGDAVNKWVKVKEAKP